MSHAKQSSTDEDSTIYPFCLHARVSQEEKVKQAEFKEEILRNCQVVATTCINAASEDLSDIISSFLIVDEAGQVCFWWVHLVEAVHD